MLLSQRKKRQFLVMVLAINFTLATQLCFADADNDPATLADRANGYGIVRIALQKQQESGLKTAPAQTAHFQDEFETSGKIISIGSLLALRERYLLAKAEHKAAIAKMNQASQSLNRQQELYKNGISSQRTLQELEAQRLSVSSAVDAADVKLAAVTSEIRLHWGDRVSAWALAENSNQFKSFLTGQEFLLLITIPANRSLASELTTVQVHRSGRRADAQPALLIGNASQIDSNTQGESYYFRLRGEHYRTGMKLSVWVPAASHQVDGVIVPESAFIWYMDQAFVYVKDGKEDFVRRAVTGFSAVPGGYFLNSGLNSGEELVISGAQMLLSEELRQQIPGEDD
jgi:hypothetical protein